MSTQGDLRQTLLQRAQDLFALCDRQGKGYAFKEELGALGEEFPLSPEELEVVFDSLDADGDGKLTLQEFSDGFGMFLGIDSQPRNPVNAKTQAEEEDEDEDEVLEELLDHLGARNLFTDEDYVREMWRRVRKDDPVMRSNFEHFIARMAGDLRQSVDEKESLHSTLKSRDQENESRVQSLYAEMEEQLKQDRENALAREQWKEQRLRDELETELQFKDLQLQELLQKHSQIEKQLEDLNSGEAETKHENQKLQKDRDILESRLSASERMLEDMKKHLNLLRKRSLEEKRKRAQSALKVSEGIALERENLVLELQNLKEINKQLLDEKDELEQSVHPITPQRSPKLSHSEKYQQSKNLRNDISGTRTPSSSRLEKQSCPMTLDRMLTKEHPLDHTHNDLENTNEEMSLDFSCEEDCEEEIIQNNLNLPVAKKEDNQRRNVRSRHGKYSPSFGRTLPKIDENFTKVNSLDENATPTRVFKVVFVGDSGVGKTCILQRFCTSDFKETFSATIGVDFQVKTVHVDGETIALQLWDTAGQERFRSMTQQYFRKSDGIIVVYDVTSEISFKSVRNWMHSIQEGAEEGAVVLLLGNKIDMCESDEDRVIKAKDGERIADEFGTLFYETSAKTGSSVQESIEGLACVLKSKEDETMDQVLKLQEELNKRKRKKCC